MRSLFFTVLGCIKAQTTSGDIVIGGTTTDLTEATTTSQYRFGSSVVWYAIVQDSIKWTVTLQVNVNEDSGEQSLRITHELEAPILITDTVVFELSFVPASKWDNVDDSDYATGLGEDAGRCEMANNEDDPRFWTATLTDIYYKCNGTPAAPTTGTTTQPQYTKCSASDNTYNSNSVLTESSANNDWTLPYKDNDPDSPWCTPANSADVYSPYQCSKIKCVMERYLDTQDTLYDWAFQDIEDTSFDVNGGVYDEMWILNNRASVWISSADFDVAMTAPTQSKTITDTVDWTQNWVKLPITAGAALMLVASITISVLMVV